MKQFIQIDLQRMQRTLLIYLQRHWKLFLLEGIIFVVFGILAIIIPQIFSMGITFFLGWLLLIGGFIQIIRVVRIYSMPAGGFWLVSGILQTIIGYFFVTEPAQGSLTLTMMLMIFFALEGLVQIYVALLMRPLVHWGRMLFSGVTALFFAIVVWAGWPTTGLWILGLLLGINMVLLGWALIKISLHHKVIP
jgi:uncharacterized membrane protein HdeD (DUF308 family)